MTIEAGRRMYAETHRPATEPDPDPTAVGIGALTYLADASHDQAKREAATEALEDAAQQARTESGQPGLTPARLRRYVAELGGTPAPGHGVEDGAAWFHETRGRGQRCRP